MPDLSNHRVISSRDLSEARQSLNEDNSIDKIELIGKRSEIDLTINGLFFDELNLSHFSYGDSPTRFVAGEGPDVMQFIVTTAGGGVATHRNDRFEMTEAIGFARDMSLPHISVLQNIDALALSIPFERLRQHAQTLLGTDAPMRGLKFEGSFDMTKRGAVHVRNTLEYAANALNGPLRHLDNEISLKSLSELLLTTILMHLPNSYSDMLHNLSVNRAVPYHVKRARDFIHGNAGGAITLDILAKHAGCSFRTLQRGFKDSYGMSPMAYLRDVRLIRIRDELLNPENDMTIQAIASRWGFTHMSNFAIEYRNRFGELPSDTRHYRG